MMKTTEFRPVSSVQSSCGRGRPRSQLGCGLGTELGGFQHGVIAQVVVLLEVLLVEADGIGTVGVG